MRPSRSSSADGDSVPMLEPRPAVFGTSDGWSDTESDLRIAPDEDRAGTRRTFNLIAGVVVICALLGCLVVAVWPHDNGQATLPIQPPATSLPAAVTTAPATTGPSALATTITTPVQPGYVIDTPVGYRASAYQYDEAAYDRDTPTSDVQLWAAPESSRTSGRWFIVQAAQGSNDSLIEGAQRIAVGDRAGLLSTSFDGVDELQFVVNPDLVSAVITAHGLSREELVQIATSIVIDDQGGAAVRAPADVVNVIHSRSFSMVGPGIGLVFNLIVAATSTQYYASDDPSARGISITVSHPPIEMQSLLPYLLADEHDEQVDGRTFTIGSLHWSADPADSTLFAISRDTSATVTIQTSMSDDLLHDALTSLRHAGSDEWTQLIADGQAEQNTPAVAATPPTPPNFVLVARNEPSTAPWTVAIDSDRGQFRLQMDSSGTESSLDLSIPIQRYVSTDLTLFVVAIGQDTGATTFRLTTPTTNVDLPLQSIGSLMAAAMPLAEITTYTAEILDANGTTIASVAG